MQVDDSFTVSSERRPKLRKKVFVKNKEERNPGMFCNYRVTSLSQARARKLYTRQFQASALIVTASLHVISTLFCSTIIIRVPNLSSWQRS